MKRYLITGDWHLDARTAGVRRYADIEKAASQTVDDAIQFECTDYVFAGDLCDPDSPCVFRSIELAIYFSNRLTAAGVRSHWLVGNHDVVEDGSGDHVLLPLMGAQRAELEALSMVHELPAVVRGVAFFPFCPLATRYDPKAQVEELRGMHGRDIKLVVSHLQLEGITPGGERDFARGRDEFLPVKEIREAWPRATIVNAHYHQPGRHDGVILPGSLVPLTKADTGRRGYVLVEV
jgi:DNA repair exonuclease SbcCD nuclease subunit